MNTGFLTLRLIINMMTKTYSCRHCKYSIFCGIINSGMFAIRYKYPKDGNCTYFTEARRPGDGAKKDRKTER